MTVQTSPRWPWLMLIARLCLFATIQALFALGFAWAGSSTAWENAAGWWPFVVTLVNFICVALLIPLFKNEGIRYWDIYKFDKQHLKSDLRSLLIVCLIIAPVGFLPNILLGKALFGDPQIALDLLVRPLPLWAAVAGALLFPLTQGIAELATYFAYVMPRFEKQGLPAWAAVSIPALFLGIQHCAVPLLFNPPFFIWRLLMFIPFAFLIGIVLHWRSRLLPYLAIVHVLMDLSVGVMFILAAN